MPSYSSLHIHTETNPHKVSYITQRYLQICSYQRPSMEYSQKTPCLRLLISALFSVGECLLEGRWGERWVERPRSFCVLGMGTGASRDWTLSSGVNRRAGLWAHKECSLLISFKGAWDSLKEKQTSLLEDTDGSYGRFFLPCFALVGRFKAALQIPNDSICHEGSDLRHVSFFYHLISHTANILIDLYTLLIMPIPPIR